MKRIGLIGVGYWGSKYLRLLKEMPSVKLGFVVDTNEERLDELSPTLDCPSFDNVKEALDSDLVDGVIVATPASTHRRMVEECLATGLHVLVEKPLVTSVEDAFSLAKLSQASGRILFPGNVYAYNDAINALSSLAEDGTFGSIRYVTCVRTGLGPVRGDVNALWDLVPHDLTILQAIGLGLPKSVMAVGSSFLQEDIEDVVFCNLSYFSGSVAHIQASWLEPYKTRRVTIVGSRRMAIFDDVAIEDRLKIYERGIEVKPAKEYGEFRTQIRSGDVLIPFVPSREPLRNMVEAFLRTFETPNDATGQLVDGIRIVATLEAMNRSMRSNGASVEMDWKDVDQFFKTVLLTP